MSSHVQEESSWTLPSLIEQAIAVYVDSVAVCNWCKVERFLSIIYGLVGPDPEPKEDA